MRYRKIVLFLIVLMMLSGFYSSVGAQEPVWLDTVEISGNKFDHAFAVAISGSGKTLAISTTTGITLFELPSLNKSGHITVNSWAYSLKFVPGTNTVLAAIQDGTVIEIDTASGKIVEKIQASGEWTRSISIDAAGSTYATASDDDIVRIWSISDHRLLGEVDNATYGLRAAAISSDGSRVAGVLRNNMVKVWDTQTGSEVYTLTGHTDWPRKLEFSPDGSWLISGGFDKKVFIWDLSNGKQKYVLDGHGSSVLSLTISPDGKKIASGSVDETIRIWDANSGKIIRILNPDCGFIYDLDFDPNSLKLYAACENGQLKVIRLEEIPDQSAEVQIEPVVSSDCRSCHHQRAGGTGVRVPQMSCKTCHEAGANFNWCPIFPRATNAPSIFQMSTEKGDSGISIGVKNTILNITTPSNGESYYASTQFMVPGFLKGRITKEGIPIQSGQVEISVTDSNGNIFHDSAPIQNGQFSRQIRLNPEKTPAGTNFNHSTDCSVCHQIPADAIGLSSGSFVVEVSYSTDGEIVSDRRFFNVDIPERLPVPVLVFNSETKKNLSGAIVLAESFHLGWRERTSSAVTGTNGDATILVEKLPESFNAVAISMQPTIIDGVQHKSEKDVHLQIFREQQNFDPIVLLAKASAGDLKGTLRDNQNGMPIRYGSVSAFLEPSGPILNTQVKSDGSYEFKNLAPGDYVIRPFGKGFNSTNYVGMVADQQVLDLELRPEIMKSVQGRVLNEEGEILPIAWIRSDNNPKVITVNPVDGSFTSPVDERSKYLVATAPGYYARVESYQQNASMEFVLEPKPDLGKLPWGDGFVYIPQDTYALVSDNGIKFEYGSLWGINHQSSKPFTIKTKNSEISISEGSFSLNKINNSITWLNILEGEAVVSFESGQRITVPSGYTVSVEQPSEPIKIKPELGLILWETKTIPVRETFSPEFHTKVRELLIMAGLTTIKFVTFMTYIGVLVILAIAPLMFIRIRNRMRS